MKTEGWDKQVSHHAIASKIIRSLHAGPLGHQGNDTSPGSFHHDK